MTAALLFTIVTRVAIVGWIVLVTSLRYPQLQRWIVFPILLILGVGYVSLMLAFFGSAPGAFASLEEYARLISNSWILVAGWIHYLVFDLVVGIYEVRTARAERIPGLFVVPALFLTFAFGPAGLILFQLVRVLRARVQSSAVT